MPDQAKTPAKSHEPKDGTKAVELGDGVLEKVVGGVGIATKKFRSFSTSGDADDRPTEE